VYLAIEPTGWIKCPYCGAEYTLNRTAAGPADIKSEVDA
jgi:sarcosine oxidase delta subunit